MVYEVENKDSVGSNFYSYMPDRSLFKKGHKCFFYSLLNEYELDTNVMFLDIIHRPVFI
jgi:hypothetical protein